MQKYTAELLAPLVKTASSYSHLTRLLKPSFPGVHLPHIRKCVKDFKLDISHFTGKTQPKGQPRYAHWSAVLIHRDLTNRKPGHVLRKALCEFGRKYECVDCRNTGSWNNKPITLEVDHKDSNWQNNTPENLQFLCPNCHAQKPKKLNR